MGRRSLGKEPTETLHVRIPGEIAKALRAQAKQTGVDVATVARSAFELFLYSAPKRQKGK
jgi:hypothetical protein